MDSHQVLTTATDFAGNKEKITANLDIAIERPWVLQYKTLANASENLLGPRRKHKDLGADFEEALASRLEAQKAQRKKKEYRAALGLDDYRYKDDINKVGIQGM